MDTNDQKLLGGHTGPAGAGEGSGVKRLAEETCFMNSCPFLFISG